MVFFGYKKGLIGVAFNLCAFLVAIIVTWILYNPVTNLVINNTEIDDGIKNAIIEKGVMVVKQEKIIVSWTDLCQDFIDLFEIGNDHADFLIGISF